MKAFHAKRLAKLANFLDRLPPEDFDIDEYGKELSCHTVACVAGWSGTIPEFRRAGLRTDFHNGVCSITLHGDQYPVQSSPPAIFFGLSGRERQELFYRSGYNRRRRVKPKDAARKVRSIMKRHGYDQNGRRYVSKSFVDAYNGGEG